LQTRVWTRFPASAFGSLYSSPEAGKVNASGWPTASAMGETNRGAIRAPTSEKVGHPPPSSLRVGARVRQGTVVPASTSPSASRSASTPAGSVRCGPIVQYRDRLYRATRWVAPFARRGWLRAPLRLQCTIVPVDRDAPRQHRLRPRELHTPADRSLNSAGAPSRCVGEFALPDA
jgi:hypothetical protein